MACRAEPNGRVNQHNVRQILPMHDETPGDPRKNEFTRTTVWAIAAMTPRE
jgi:hypothetical protein